MRSFPAILNQSIDQSIVAKMPLSKAVAFAAGLGLCMLSCPVHAAPTSGGDTVRGLYDALLSTMKNGRTLGQSVHSALRGGSPRGLMSGGSDDCFVPMTVLRIVSERPAAKHRRRPPLLVGLVMIAIASGGYLGWQHFAHTPGAAVPEPTSLVPVIAATVKQQNFPIVLTGIGNVAALNSATVRSLVTEAEVLAVDGGSTDASVAIAADSLWRCRSRSAVAGA